MKVLLFIRAYIFNTLENITIRMDAEILLAKNREYKNTYLAAYQRYEKLQRYNEPPLPLV